MRICFLNHDTEKNTGAGRFVLNLVSSLKKIKPGWRFDILTHKDGLPTNPLFCGGLKNKLKDYDVFHALDGWPYGVIATNIGEKLGKKIVITAIGTGAVKPLYSFLKKPFLSRAYKNADVVTAISNNTKKEILKIIPDLDIKVINHGVNFEKFRNLENKKLKVDLKPYILSVGMLKKRKGYDYSIEAFSKIVDKFPDLKYIIVGSGPEREDLESKVERLKLKDRVVFLDRVHEKELISLYHNAELFLLLPIDDDHDIEGFGLVFLEAAACGLLVIGGRDSGAEDAILDNRNGFLVDSKNSEEVSEKIAKVLNKEAKEKFLKRSIQFAQEMSWDKVAKQYINKYNGL